MIVKQPFFLLGLDDYEVCKDSAFGAMWIFIMTFAVSVIYIVYESSSKPPYEEVDHREERPMLPPGMTDYRVNSEVELSELMHADLREIS